MIVSGASGPTLNQMLQFLRCKQIKDVHSHSMKMMGFASSSSESGGSGQLIQCLNGIWFDQQYGILNPSFHDLAQKIYNANLKSSDFVNKANEVVDEANMWAKESTKGLITKVLEHGDLDEVIVLLGNALYFKGSWKHAFKRGSTKKRNFYLMNGTEKKNVPFMIRSGFPSQSFGTYDVVRLPYKTGENGNKFSMYIFLPKDRFGLPELLQVAASDSSFLRKDFELNKYGVFDDYFIPKFKFSYYTSKGKDTMKEMGLTLPFSSKIGGLKEMVKGKNIEISKIVQKSFIEVNEKGTKAAAVTFATGGLDGAMGPPPPRRKFIADHPFMFMIREKNTKVVLFSGVVLDPLQH